MYRGTASVLTEIVETVCWGICFVWIHRTAAKQKPLPGWIGEQGRRIKTQSRIAHSPIGEVLPQFGEIKEGLIEANALEERAC